MNRTTSAALGAVVLVALCTSSPAMAYTHSNNMPKEQVKVDEVFTTAAGQHVVVLKTFAAPSRYLPIWIAEREALAIRIRLERQIPPRPLTLHLMESILKSSDSKLQSVSIDEVHGNLFLGQIRLRQNNRTWTLDARPSDAIGLALGQGSPIWVAKTVLDQAAFEAKMLTKKYRPADAPSPQLPPSAPHTAYGGSI